MTRVALSARPLCAEVAAALGEPVGATASRIEHWLLVEYSGHWPYDPLDAEPFRGAVREHLAAQLAALQHSRLLLVKRARATRRERTQVIYGVTRERGRRFFSLELEDYEQLLEVDLARALSDRTGVRVEHPLLLVCTHGVRDRCCARYGQALCRALHTRAPAAWVWQSSHVGGDRFAGNVVFLPEGLYFGRVRPAEASSVYGDYLGGRIALDHYRGASCHSFPVQAAELHVRRLTGLTGFYDLRVLSHRRHGRDRWLVELLAEVAGDVHAVEVVAAPSPDERYLTCRATTPRRARRFVAETAVTVPR